MSTVVQPRGRFSPLRETEQTVNGACVVIKAEVFAMATYARDPELQAEV